MQTEEQLLPGTSLDVKPPSCGADEYELVYHRPETLLDVKMHYCP